MSLMNTMKFYLHGSPSPIHHKKGMDTKSTGWISWMKSFIILILIVIVTCLCIVCYFGKSNEKQNIYNKRPICESNSEYSIDYLTSMQNVTLCLEAGIVPKFYLTKEEAKERGWKPKKGNLCEMIPNHAIGGDYYYNKDGKLPVDHEFREFDINFTCSCRGAERLAVSTNDPTHQYYSKDHYKNFVKHTM